ncbi:hypothetical protein D8674_024625 [Pyrus ussuriensis x Pyrus communis]|uniref:YbaK/aminoacyl-tRNA synthetase-associated domain-containing protein n=1 Tax=Pyrus ussuriensis x Pyrus communis TaxID=2448454 RepID=A0A5N5H7A6_9ROSA|nr:hypothetical protein D8674_024625 [Pyrus ussuriensis x Pyrus communis]
MTSECRGRGRGHARPEVMDQSDGGQCVIVGEDAQAELSEGSWKGCERLVVSRWYVKFGPFCFWVQYTARFNAEAVKNFLYSLNEGKIAKKKFNCQFLKVIVVVIGYALRLAPEDTSIELTGFEHNAVTCVGMKTDIPVILDEAIEKPNPDFFWLGGSEVDLKLGIRTSEFINFAKPFIVSCSSS